MDQCPSRSKEKLLVCCCGFELVLIGLRASVWQISVVLGSILSPTLLKKLFQLSSCLQGSQSVKGSEELDNTHKQNHWFFAKNLQ
jgi:hypothetical protein